MLTRARAKAANQPIFVDEQWSDAYILNKDEQIDAIHADRVRASGSGGWSDHDSINGSDHSSDDSDDPDADVWRSDDETNVDSDDSDDDSDGSGIADVTAPPPPAVTANRRLPTSWIAGGSWADNVVWTTLTLLGVPMFLYATLLKRRTTPWPLESTSLRSTLVKVTLNVFTLATLSAIAYSVTCVAQLPLTLSPLLLWRHHVDLLRPRACYATLHSLWQQCELLTPSDARLSSLPPVCRDALVQTSSSVVVLLVAALCFHRRWLKLLLLLSAALYAALNSALALQANQRAAVRIASLDPLFAYANESIFVAIDGQNLAEGAVIAWAPYWRGLDVATAANVDKLFPAALQHGGVRVTFDAVNDYVPCYAPPAAIDARTSHSDATKAFVCFDAMRLRVKDLKSVPGWSLRSDAATATEKNEL